MHPTEMRPGWQALVAGGIAALVGLTEIITRYRSDPRRAVTSLPALVYIVLNGGAGALALYLVRSFGWTFGHASNVTLWRILIAGFGALALFRSSLFVAKIGNTNVGVGPSAALEGLLGALDRDVDRKCALAISKEVTEANLAGLNPQAVMSALPVLCLALMQNFPAGDQALLGADLSKVENDDKLPAEAKVRAVVIQLSRYLSAEMVVGVLTDARPLFVIPPREPAVAVLEQTKKLASPSPETDGDEQMGGGAT
jgi:hypothetical protein